MKENTSKTKINKNQEDLENINKLILTFCSPVAHGGYNSIVRKLSGGSRPNHEVEAPLDGSHKPQAIAIWWEGYTRSKRDLPS